MERERVGCLNCKYQPEPLVPRWRLKNERIYRPRCKWWEPRETKKDRREKHEQVHREG